MNRRQTPPVLIGQAQSFLRAVEQADRYSRSHVPVLLVGETGTGKELIAARLHAMSGVQGEFVAVNCATLSPEMADSILFGHRRGAFTGAWQTVAGLVATASSGTLFLDELGSMPMDTQGKILRVADLGHYRMLGHHVEQCADCRMVAAVHPASLAAGEVRPDLYQRLAVAVISLPPLRERPGDAGLIARHAAEGCGRQLSAGAAGLLERQPWPGNVRELLATLQRACILSSSSTISEADVAESLGFGRRHHPASALRHSERVRLEQCREMAQGDWRVMVRMLGISKSNLYRKLQGHGIRLRR